MCFLITFLVNSSFTSYVLFMSGWSIVQQRNWISFGINVVLCHLSVIFLFVFLVLFKFSYLIHIRWRRFDHSCCANLAWITVILFVWFFFSVEDKGNQNICFKEKNLRENQNLKLNTEIVVLILFFFQNRAAQHQKTCKIFLCLSGTTGRWGKHCRENSVLKESDKTGEGRRRSEYSHTGPGK